MVGVGEDAPGDGVTVDSFCASTTNEFGTIMPTTKVWLLFPAIGIYVCLRLILDGRFDILWS